MVDDDDDVDNILCCNDVVGGMISLFLFMMLLLLCCFDEPILCTSYLCGGRTGLTTNANEPLARMMKNDSTLQLIRWCTMVTSLEVDNNTRTSVWQMADASRDRYREVTIFSIYLHS